MDDGVAQRWTPLLRGRPTRPAWPRRCGFVECGIEARAGDAGHVMPEQGAQQFQGDKGAVCLEHDLPSASSVALAGAVAVPGRSAS